MSGTCQGHALQGTDISWWAARLIMTEHSFQGIHFLLKKGGSVTHVSGTKCHLCVRPLTDEGEAEEGKQAAE